MRLRALLGSLALGTLVAGGLALTLASAPASPVTASRVIASSVTDAPAQGLTVVVAGPESLPVGGVTGTVRVSVTEGGVPAPDGTGVLLDTSLGSLRDVTGVTDGGAFTTVLTTGITAGTAEILAQVGEAVGAFTTTFNPGPPQALELRPGELETVAGVTVTVEAAVYDAFGNSVADETAVDLAAQQGTMTPSPALTTAGVARAGYYGTVAGSAIVTATAGEGQITGTVRVAPADPSQMGLHLATDRLPVDDGVSSLDVEVTDRWGNRADRPIMVELSAGGGTVRPSQLVVEAGAGRAEYRADAVPGRFELAAVSSAGLTATQQVELRPADLSVATRVTGPDGDLPEAQLNPGDPVTYSITVSNTDLATARDVELALVAPTKFDLAPAGATATITPTNAPQPGLIEPPPPGHTRLAWRLPSIAQGEMLRVEVSGRVPVEGPWTGFDSHFFRAATGSDTAEASPGDLSRGTVVPVHATDVSVALELDRDNSALRPGGQVVYDITLGNEQRQTAIAGVWITSTPSTGLAFAAWQPLAGTTRIAPTGALTPESTELGWVFQGEFGLGQGLRLWLDIDPDAPADFLLTHRVEVRTDVTDIQPHNNVQQDTRRLTGVNLTATASGPATAAVGSHLAYEVGVTNNSQSDLATAVTVNAHPPDGTRIVSAPGGTLRPDGSVVWELVEVAAGGRAAFPLVVEIPEATPLGTRLELGVEVSSAERDSFQEDNRASVSTDVVAGPADVIELQPSARSAAACGDAGLRLVARVADAFGHPVADGTRIQWRAPSGSFSAGPMTTTSGGESVNSWFPPRSLGPVRLEARSGTVVSTTQVDVTPGPLAALNLSVNPQIVPKNGTSVVAVNGLDRCSNPVADGTSVLLSAQRGAFAGGAGSSLNGRLLGGRLEATLAVGMVSGPLRVTATGNGVLAEAMLSVSDVMATPTPRPTPTRRPGAPAWRIFLPLTVR